MLLTKGLINAGKNFAGKMAIIDGHHTYTYAQFAARTAKLKHSLTELGVQKGDRVAILMLNSFRYLEIMYGVTAAGAVFVPLNVRLTPREIAFILNNAEVQTLYIHREFLPMLPELKKSVPHLQHVILAEDEEIEIPKNESVLSYETLLACQPDVPLEMDDIDEDDVAGLLYTSGTTGRPKGVMLTHKNLVSNAYHCALSLHYTEDDIYLHTAPMFHAADAASTFAITLVGGTHAHIRAFSPKAVLRAYQEIKVTCGLLVPTMINMLFNEPDFDQYDVSSLRCMMYGGSPMPVEVLKKAARKIPHLKFFQAYGMSEASPILTVLHAKDHVIGGTEKEEKRLASCGKPVAGVEMKVVDAEDNELPPGEIGEVIARGPNIMKGYWNMPEETDRAMRGGWYHSGDMAYADEDGFYYIVDRAKDMIITGGENVYSIEVENVLYEHPAVVECAVVGVPDERWGEAVKAVVVVRPESGVTEEELIQFARSHLAGYKTPKTVTFIDQLPKSGAGKILKRELRDVFWQGIERKVN
jgi:long-chain acyl-CoA synthetase